VPSGILTSAVIAANAVGTVNPDTIAKSTKIEPNAIVFIGKGS